MENGLREYSCFWNGKQIGTVSVVERDMWYIGARWLPLSEDAAETFEKMLASNTPQEILEDPGKAMKLELRRLTNPDKRIYCLAFSLADGILNLPFHPFISTRKEPPYAYPVSAR
ncbi:hypothetical protein HHL16_02875 [Pseudoflavitalea sp. G-6-1-2]|uniref:hypothetical protein n=1 Tax=Pseudoflavitalea sp. G-6-1-2 TaxID=2728841 RepID=UPI00146BB25B|nr:hypothetical protein [Pseudoflavitalea sp. G-6-1-2]NML19796.1 hypothetical protein [Pseudoflavitalea sp. G-6-1-2]